MDTKKEKIRLLLSERRKELGLTMKELSSLVGVSEATISRWESGDIANMRRDRIASLAKALKISPAVIMGWENSSSSSESDQVDSLFIEKYSRDVYDAAMKYSKLDSTDKVRATERIDMMLEDPKYRLGGASGEKAI